MALSGRGVYFLPFCRSGGTAQQTPRRACRSPRCFSLLAADYGFLGAGFFVIAGVFLTGVLPPIRVNASVALKGNCRVEVWPVVLKVTSTRRLLAILIVTMFLIT